MPSTGQQAILRTGYSDELDYYLLQLLLEMENSPAWTCAASLESQPCSNTGYVAGACLPLVVSFPEPQRRVRALQGSNDTLIVNGTLTITLPQRLSATLTNDTTIVMISKSALAGADNAATCAEQSVTRLPAMLTASGCGADTYVLLVTRKDTVIDPMIIPPSTSGPALKSGVSALVVGLAVCGIVVVVVGGKTCGRPGRFCPCIGLMPWCGPW